jgi:Kef-type K+ transport system membrane component KefB
MGLELSMSRLKSLAKYAFGLGFLQIALGTAILALALLPAGDALGTRVLQFVQPELGQDLVQIHSTLQAFVISYALSLSSSAF